MSDNETETVKRFIKAKTAEARVLELNELVSLNCEFREDLLCPLCGCLEQPVTNRLEPDIVEAQLVQRLAMLVLCKMSRWNRVKLLGVEGLVTAVMSVVPAATWRLRMLAIFSRASL
jgi:hypothetical protein